MLEAAASVAPTRAGARPSPRWRRARWRGAAGGAAARALRRAPGPVQGSKGGGAGGGAAAAHAIGQAAAKGAAMKADAGSHRNAARAPGRDGDPVGDGEHPAEEHRRRSAAHWEEAARGWVRRQQAIREFGAPVALDGRGDRAPARPARARARGRPGRDGAAGGRAGRADRRGDPLRPCRGDAQGRPRTRGEARPDQRRVPGVDAEWIDLPVASVDAVLAAGATC